MTHTVQLNNFVKIKKVSSIDCISKTFLFIQWLLGLNRMRLLFKKLVPNLLFTAYALCAFALIVYGISCKGAGSYGFAEILKLMQYSLISLLCLTSSNRFRCYYDELNTFDKEVSCVPKVTRVAILLILSMILICVCTVPVFIINDNYHFIPLHVIHIIEAHYYALLFHLINQRLRLINFCIESSLLSHSNSEVKSKSNCGFIFLKTNSKKRELPMNKFMDLYYIIINAYDMLTEAIKWQLLFIITTSFAYTLTISYSLALIMLSGTADVTGHLVNDGVVIVSEALPLMAPCVCCDTVRREVRRLRELLASKLFESKLDKPNRSVARALLALTKARNLSFSLLRMVDISISLPFSFLGLLATYLIILLQFEKVINPARSTADISTVATVEVTSQHNITIL